MALDDPSHNEKLATAVAKIGAATLIAGGDVELATELLREPSHAELIAWRIWNAVWLIAGASVGFAYFGYGGLIAGLILGIPVGIVLIEIAKLVLKALGVAIIVAISLAILIGVPYAIITLWGIK